MPERYRRQELIEEWDQSKLKQATVTILGAGAVAKYAALALTAIGVGTMRLFDTAWTEPGNCLLDIKGLERRLWVSSIVKALSNINPEVKFIGTGVDMHAAASQYFLRNSSVVIDATNSVKSKAQLMQYCHQTETRWLSAGANASRGKVVAGTIDPIALLPMFDHATQDELVGLEIGGVVADEAKKLIMGTGALARQYDYNLESRALFSHVSDRTIKNDPNAFDKKNVLLVGAGALGCFVGPAVAICLQPARIDIMDYDTVEEHNLNRQVCHYDAVGELKSESMEKKLTAMTGKQTKVRGINQKFEEGFRPDTKYDLIFDCVDSFYTKAIVHNWARKNGIPIVSGGTDPRAATVLVYAPGRTSCLDCQINLSALGVRAEIIRRTRCTEAPNPSVIMTNQIAGAIMAAQARCVLRPDLYGEPVNGHIRYIGDLDARGGTNPRAAACTCSEARSLELPDESRVEVRTEGDQNVVLLDGKKI